MAIVAVLKTGAAYLPIDPGLPAARIGFMLADAAPIAVLTTTDLAGRLDGCDLLVIDIDDPAVDTQPGTALPAPAPEDIAYLIYTSGTTGVPKGVAVTPPQRDPAAGVTGRWLGSVAGTGVDAMPFLCVRLLGVGDLRCAAAVVGGWWWCPSRWWAHQKTFTACWLRNRSAC